MRNAKVDTNQPEIVKALRKAGAVVKHVHQLKNLFDILVYYNGNTYNVEIKQSHKHKLTDGELSCKNDLNSVGVKYWVITSIDDALEMINYENV